MRIMHSYDGPIHMCWYPDRASGEHACDCTFLCREAKPIDWGSAFYVSGSYGSERLLHNQGTTPNPFKAAWQFLTR